MISKQLQIPIDAEGQVHGIIYKPEKEMKKENLIILCHGFQGDQQEWGRFPAMAQAITDHGWTALSFDFRGSGLNEREPITITKQISDLEHVYQWALEQGFSRISILGLSFGGLTALLANCPERLTTIFWAPAFFMDKILGFRKIILKILFRIRSKPLRLFSKNNSPVWINSSFVETIEKLETEQILKEFENPCLILQGTKDKAARPRFTRLAYELLSKTSSQKYVEVPGAGHNFKNQQLQEFISHSIDWLKTYHS